MNGSRSQPPSWLELQTTKTKQPISLHITLMDGNTRSLLADSASTARELCSQLGEKIGLKDQFGFSLYIALYDKVSSLGGGTDHVMDAVSQCEQYAKEKGVNEARAPWRLFYRKEIFSPWHDVMEDAVSTSLIYQQCVRGIKHGEFRCDKAEDLAMLTAQQLYVECGADTRPDTLLARLPQYLPQMVVTADKPLHHWQALVTQAWDRSYYLKEHAANIKVKEDVVNFAKYKWPLLFSRFYEAVRTSGPKLPKDQVIIAVNWTGIYMVDDQEQVLLELTFPEIKAVSSKKYKLLKTKLCFKTHFLRSERVFQNFITFSTIRNEDFTFSCTNAEDIKGKVFLVECQDIEPCDHRRGHSLPGRSEGEVQVRGGDEALPAGWPAASAGERRLGEAGAGQHRTDSHVLHVVHRYIINIARDLFGFVICRYKREN